jgi:alanine racemase
MSIRKNLDTWLRRFEKEYVTHNCITVSRSAIVHNVNIFRQLSGKAIIPVLKGNAYGHGIQLVAQALARQQFPYIAVDGYFEALRVREVSNQAVLVLGAILPENFANMRYDNFAFAVQDAPTIHALGKTGKHIAVHLECNTGMNRYGAEPDDVTALAKLIVRYKNLTLEGVMSHLADSDGEDPATIDNAVDTFDTCVDRVREAGANPSLMHVAQTAGSLRAQSRHANAIRLGVGLYGINPFPAGHSLYAPLQRALRPALTFTSTITHIIDLKKGEKVSYNYTFTAPRAMRIGIIPAGYYEGVDRALSNRGAVQVGSAYAPIVGRVCMNHTMISLEECPHAQVGDQVTIYSNNPADHNSISVIAKQHNLFAYNLLTSLSCDVRRVLGE